MTRAEKINKELRTLIKGAYINDEYVYSVLKKYAYIEARSFDTQIYLHDFYLSFTYSRDHFSSMSVYTSRYDVNCPVICFESDGNILIGCAMENLNIYNGCSPSIMDLNLVGIDMAGFQYLLEFKNYVEPIMEKLAELLRKNKILGTN